MSQDKKVQMESQGSNEGDPVVSTVPKGNTLEYIVNLGKQAGFEGEELKGFIKEQQNLEREERNLRRNHDAEMARMHIERQKLEFEQQMYISKQSNGINESQLDSSTVSESGLIPRLPKFNSDKDNLDAYLLRFERYAKIKGWNKSNWAISLSSLLDGKALDVYSRLSSEFADDYERLKKVLLGSFHLDEDGFRAKFFSTKQAKDETFEQYVTKVGNYFDRWVSLSGVEQNYAGLRQLLIREQCLHNSDAQLSTFVRERNPDSLDSVLESATCFERAHPRRHSNNASSNSKFKFKPRSNDTGSKDSKSAPQVSEKPKKHSNNFPFRKPNQFGSRTCFECGSSNHIRRDCPKLSSGHAAVPASKADESSE